ncbi:Death domain-associated protein 6 [Orchesella cincta]|uniref:Death domain-associated protein 6 n=1 Tax=Orchesella cincta TaxID=48709 RepID=A0A1D2M209_ORCCI|nr:Death domain-associated protein 6 [Orchesella cincta]
MAAVSSKVVYDEEVICLSSSDDDEISEVSRNDILKSVLLPSKVSVAPIGASTKIMSNGRSSNGSVLRMSVKNEADKNEVILDDDDFEIETIREKLESVQKASADSDEEIQVLHEPDQKDSVPNDGKGQNLENGDEEPSPGPSSSISLRNETDKDYVKLNQLALNKLLGVMRREAKIKTKDYDKLQTKIAKTFDKIKHLQQKVHKNLHQEIENAIESIKTLPSGAWRTLKPLFDIMKPENVVTLNCLTPEAEEQRRLALKLKAHEKLEKEMEKIHHKIEEFDELEVDLFAEDDHNSAYMMGDRFKRKFINGFYKACDIQNSSRFTERPVQKKINLRKCGADCPYQEVNEQVEKFLNKKGFLFNPDFKDIHNIFIAVNKSVRLGLTDETLMASAKETFTKVALVIKKRRKKDHEMTLFDLVKSDSIIDPAEEDEELRKKLEANEAVRGSEKEVLDVFRKRQDEQGNTPTEVADEEDIDASPPPSDNEEEDEEEEEEDDDVDVNDNADDDDSSDDADGPCDGPDQDELIDEEDDDETVYETDFKLAMEHNSRVENEVESQLNIRKAEPVERVENPGDSTESQMELGPTEPANETESVQRDKRPADAADEPPSKRVRMDEEDDSDATTICSGEMV